MTESSDSRSAEAHSSGSGRRWESSLSTSLEVAGQEAHLFVEAKPFLDSLLTDLSEAEHRIWLESYIFLDDQAGKSVARVLSEKARKGLDVRLIYDAIGSLSTSSTLFERMETAGVKVHCYHSFGEALYRFSFSRILNRRNHRKLVIIDDKVGYFGGMNIVDVSSSNVIDQAEHLSLTKGWRDVHVRLQGSSFACLEESFERSWNVAKGIRVSRRPKPYREGELEDTPRESVQFFDSGPGRRFTRAARVFSNLIRKARSRLTFSMAYFLPVGRVARELFRAARRGVRIQVIVPAESDVPIVQYATRYLYSQLLAVGIEVYERQEQMLHSKILLVDDRWAVVGSSNMDARSLWINLEFLGVFNSPTMVETLDELVEFELSKSRQVFEEDYRNTSSWERIRNYLAWGLRWWL